ncbi:hypothetical protein JX265_003290 [Neoarthrinium moseri]|uniref:TFIID subunit TAF5 NTD2 domain-containing protein n=1 Tax=Neoarthrinium moseri TaxID=1658444 RepID=A0A9Q0AQ36_9PEZI|nr:hypothetical protein JX265_003290 [Neoarthrinium moseri]
MANPGQPGGVPGQTGGTFTPVPPPTPGVGASTTAAATTSSAAAPPSNQNLNQISMVWHFNMSSQYAPMSLVARLIRMTAREYVALPESSDVAPQHDQHQDQHHDSISPFSKDNDAVTDYLLKRGYTATEATFRKEIAGVDAKAEEEENKRLKPAKYGQAYDHFVKWVEGSLDIYKTELNKVLYPVFVYTFLDLLKLGYKEQAGMFMKKHKDRFERGYHDDINHLKLIKTWKQAEDNATCQLFMKSPWRVYLSQFAAGNLFSFLERDSEECGNIVGYILTTFCEVKTAERGPIEQFSFEAIYRQAQNLDLDEIDAQEGIPGLQTGGSFTLNKDILDNGNNATVKLGQAPMDAELREEVLSELQDEDRLNPPREGVGSLVDEFNTMQPIKKEAGDSPPKEAIPLPPSRARDVVMEMQKVRENRDRFKIEGRTGGVGPGVSVLMYTIHNDLGSVSSMDFSKDQKLMAVGTMESYIRVWSLDGTPLESRQPGEQSVKVNNRKLFGHSGPIYTVQFSNAISNLNRKLYDDSAEQPETHAQYLISSSFDGTVRLWSLDTWTCLCVYKGHYGPVFKLAWGPHGHYFATGGADTTVRVWAQDRASAVRLMVGHDTPISALCWHPNGAYIFSASDESDKTIRMWSLATGSCVRIFTGHVDYISALECAPNGKILASADIGGNIFLWDIAKGERIKRMRGHGRGGIWSVSFNVESNTLVSGGADLTVRVWDVEMPAEGSRTVAPGDAGDGTIVAAGSGAGTDGKTASTGAQGATTGAGSSGTGKKKGKDVMVTPDQISAFPTKRTPVRKVMFTRMNLVVAGGCYEKER